MVPGEKPVEKGCSGSTNMESACWAGRESGNNLFVIHTEFVKWLNGLLVK